IGTRHLQLLRENLALAARSSDSGAVAPRKEVLVQLFDFAVAMVRHPIVIIPPALVVAMLYGAGKALGLPRLFWNERPRYRFSGGVATTLLAAESFLVAYLLDGLDHPIRSTGFLQFLLIGGVVWLLLVGYRSLVQQLGYRRGKSADGSVAETPR